MIVTRSKAALIAQNRQNASNKHLDTPTKARIWQSYNDHKIAFPFGPPEPKYSIWAKYEYINITKPTYYCHVHL